MKKTMSSREFNNYVIKGIIIVVVVIILAVLIMSFLGNERRKGEVKTLQRQLKERFENQGPSSSPSSTSSTSNTTSSEKLNNLLGKL